MPLQLRRGLSTQRTSKTYAEGELIYITDTGALYIGNGTTAGGVAVANLPETTIKDFTAGMFTGGSHTGISFTYNSTTKLINAAIDIELSNYEGTIVADGFRGSLFADDGSTVEGQPLVDAVSGKINLDGTVKGNIIPNANETYDIGSNSYRFKDLYLKGTSIHLGAAVITNPTSSIVDLPAGSTVGGVAIGSGGSGIVPGDTYTINIIGDMTGSEIYVPDSSLGLQIHAKKNSSFAATFYDGTSTSMLPIAPGSNIGAISIKGWNGTTYGFSGALASSWDAGATTTDDAPLSSVALVSGGGGSTYNYAIYDSGGKFTANIFQSSVYSVAGTPLPDPANVAIGARAFVSDATANTFALAYTGGGSNAVPVYSDGTYWRIG